MARTTYKLMFTISVTLRETLIMKKYIKLYLCFEARIFTAAFRPYFPKMGSSKAANLPGPTKVFYGRFCDTRPKFRSSCNGVTLNTFGAWLCSPVNVSTKPSFSKL